MPEKPGALGLILAKESVISLVDINGKLSEKEFGSDFGRGLVRSVCSDRYEWTRCILVESNRWSS